MDNVAGFLIPVPTVGTDAPLDARVAESEVEFRLLADAIPQMVWIIRPDGSNSYFNQRWVEYTGLTLEHGLGDSRTSPFHADDELCAANAWRQATTGNGDTSVACRIRRVDGVYRWMVIHGVALRDATGRITHWVRTCTDIDDAQRSHDALREQAAQLAETTTLLRIAGKIARLGGWTIQLPSRTLTWSDENCAIHDMPPGYVPTLAEGLAYYASEHRAEVLRYVDACATDGTPYDFELPITTALGRRVWVRSIGEAVRDEDGRIVRLQGAFQDISERKEAEHVLRRKNALLRIAGRITRTGGWSVEATDDRVSWSDEVFDILEFPRGVPPLLADALALYTEPWRGVVSTAVTECLRDGAPFDLEVEVLTGKGRTLWVRVSGEVERDSEGAIDRVQGALQDITDRRLAVTKLREQAALLDNARDAIVVRDLEHRIRYWNKGAERLYGWTAAEAVGRSVIDLMYPDPTAFLAATVGVESTDGWIGEMEQLTRDGEMITVEGHWTLVRDPDGHATSVLAINTDITKRKALEQQFIRAQRMESIGTLAGGIAHDLNNVLTPIVLSIDLLRPAITEPDALATLELIAASAHRGAEMVAQVLTFARGMDGRRIAFGVAEAVRDVAKIACDTFPKNITIVQRMSPNLWALTGDPTQMHQVLLNLCVNARDAMPRGGRITIAAENIVIDSHDAAMNSEAQVGPHVKIEIQDTGTGIPKDIIGKIFEPFFTTKDVGKGTGLGLATTLAIVKGHGGFIRVYSDPAIGTRLRLYLPADPTVAGDGAPATVASLPRGNDEMILVIDDEASIRHLAQKGLEAFGYQVLVAANGAEGVAVYREHQHEIRVVLTDMMMPVMAGPETIGSLRALNPRIPIIGASGISADGAMTHTTGGAAIQFLAKPYTMEALLTAVRHAVEEPTALAPAPA